MESFGASEVFSGRQLIWEPRRVRQREENKNVAEPTRELVTADGGQIAQRQELCVFDGLL